MYLRVKVKCDCGCNYEFDRFPRFDENPFCPSCRHPLDSDTLSGIYRIFEATENISASKLKFCLGQRSRN